jgi:hypothetical protein
MTTTPSIRFAISDPSNNVTPLSNEWNVLLPSERNQNDTRNLGIRIGDLFMAAETFLRENDFQVITSAARHSSISGLKKDDMMGISVCMVKHGRFYHPSKVTVELKSGVTFHLALNIAFSPEGIACVEKEWETLTVLNRLSTEHFPNVYGVTTDGSIEGKAFSILAVEWFDDYHEFHLFIDNDGKQKTIVWDTENGNRVLSENESYKLYVRVAKILTRCYNPFTCEQIQPWHHAAGDFIVKMDRESIDVRLITVRQYTSIFTEIPDDSDSLAEAVLIFLIGLSIRTRLDRANGIGETLWAAPYSIQATVQGFYEGLDSNEWTTSKGIEIKDKFNSLLIEQSTDDILDYAMMILNSYNPLSPDVPVLSKNIGNHAAELHGALKDRLSSV